MTALIQFLRELVWQLIERGGSTDVEESIGHVLREIARCIEAAMKKTLLA